MGRASNIEFQEVQANFSNVDSQVYVTPELSCWEHLGTLLRIYRGMLKNWTSQDIGHIMTSIHNMLDSLDAATPHGSSDMVAKLKEHILKALQNNDIAEARVSIVTTNDVLSAAILQHGRQATKAFQDFIIVSCSGGASRGHALVKCYERDAGRSYEDLHATSQMEQGIDTATRMQTRIDSWAVAKW